MLMSYGVKYFMIFVFFNIPQKRIRADAKTSKKNHTLRLTM